jgi:hypothetical protein
MAQATKNGCSPIEPFPNMQTSILDLLLFPGFTHISTAVPKINGIRDWKTDIFTLGYIFHEQGSTALSGAESLEGQGRNSITSACAA